MTGKKRPAYRRIIAGIIAIVLTGMITFIVNSFTGNPISAYLAEKQMAKYVMKEYPDMGLNLSKARYNFKYAGYILQASMPGSPDTHFRVIRRSDGHIYDDYEDYVLGGFNTIDRIGREMTQEIEPLLNDLFGNELSGRCFANFFGEDKDLAKAPPLDTPFDRNMDLNATIYLDFDIKNPTLEDIAGKLQWADGLLKKEGFSVGGYIVEALNREAKTGYMVRVDAEMIDGNLAEAMKNALDAKAHDDRLSVSSIGI